MSHQPFSGVMTAIITPFLKNHEIDFVAFHKLLEKQKESKINGVVVLGTTGENPTLTEKESIDLVLAALEHQTEDFHIYVGTGTNDTRTTIEKSKKFSELKSGSNKTPNGIMVVTPYYNKPSQNHLIAHYNQVCAAVPNTSVCLYNVPGRTGVHMLPATFCHIAEKNENVVAIKEASGNTNTITELSHLLNQMNIEQRVRILSGDDPTFAPSLLCGAQGVISVTSHIIPKVMLEMLSAFQAGNFKTLQELQRDSYCINNGIFVVPNPVGVKWMLAHLGLCHSELRAPLYPAQGQEIEQLNKILSQLEKSKLL